MDASPSRKACSSMPQSSASEIVGPILSSDLIFNILSRLPVEDLGKFKSVSKQWLTMITDPYFIRTHRDRSLQNPNLLSLCNSCETGKTQVEVRAQSLDGKQKREFLIDVNDTIDFLPSKWDLLFFASEIGFYVCNPSTQEVVKLPESSCCTSGEVNAGLGYIPSRNEYVLIHLFDRCLDFNVDYDIGCEIIRLTDGCVANSSWTVFDVNCLHVVRGWGVLVGNSFYWMIWEAYDQPGEDAILSFDLEKEEFGTVQPPEGCLDPNGAWSLVELGGFLCLIDTESHPLTMDIWVLKEYENHQWVKEYSIDLNGFDNGSLKLIVPLDERDGEILMDVQQESLVYYNLENKSFKRIEKIAGGWTWLRLYTESFFSLGSI